MSVCDVCFLCSQDDPTTCMMITSSNRVNAFIEAGYMIQVTVM